MEATPFLLFTDQATQDPLFACLDRNFGPSPELRRQQIALRAAGLQVQAKRLLHKDISVNVEEGTIVDQNPMKLIGLVNEASALRKAIRATIKDAGK